MEIRPVEMKDSENFLNLMMSLEYNTQDDLYVEKKINLSNTEDILSDMLQDGRSQIFLALENQEMQGYISMRGNHSETTKHRAVVSMGVLKSEQKNSIGRNLLNAAIRWAEDIQIHRLEAAIRDDHEEMIELYKMLGFLEEGERVDAVNIDGIYRNEKYLYRLIN
ncbi:GNAT family N-acetyltransferase [Salinicoccus jeotgali]|uniref:GNAT family N-acetyltransferase n=1 Tax=Salinicoccus jeotgali TaxID=381634 RepID=A0ABP7ETQ2_9STAP